MNPRAARIAAYTAAFFVLAVMTYNWLGEDCFISFRYTRNLVAGHGLVFNPGERVEGYSNLAWVILMAPFEALGIRLHLAARFLSLAFFAGLGVTAWQLGKRLLPEAQAWLAGWLAIAVLLDPLLHFHADKALETVPYAALLGIGLMAVATGLHGVLAGLALAGAVLMRPEGIGFALALLPAAMLRREDETATARLRRALSTVGIPLAVFLAQLAFRRAYYGEWVPNTMIAKHPVGLGWESIIALVASRAGLPLLAAAAAALALTSPRLRPAGLGVLGALAAAAIFQLRAGAIFNEGFRYLAPAFFPTALGVFLGFAWLSERLGRARNPKPLLLTLAILMTLPMPVLVWREGSRWFRGTGDSPRTRFHARLLESSSYNPAARLRWYFADPTTLNAFAGRWVAENLPPNATIAADQVGAFGYYAKPSQLQIDLFGLMDRRIAREGPSLPYLMQRAPDYFVIETCTNDGYWPREWRLQPHWAGFRPLVAEPEFTANYRPRWMLAPKLNYAKLGFMVFVRRDQDDGRPLETIAMGIDDTEFHRTWRAVILD